MKTKSIMTLAAMALMMAACTSEDLTQPQTPNSKGIPFTATISGKAATRAIKENTTDGILETSWAKGEKVALIYTGSNSNTVVDMMEVTEVGTDGTATISGTITGSPKDGDDVQVVYPASAVDLTTKEVKADLLAEQDGKLETIAEKYDYRMKDGAKLKVVLGSATLDGTVSLENQLAIVRFSLSDGTSALEAESFEIDDNSGQPIITVTPSSADNVFYVAMPPATAQAFHFIAKKGNEEYFYSQPSATLAAGKYYYQNMTLKDMLNTPLTLEATQDGTTIEVTNRDTKKTFQYAINGGNKTTVTGTGTDVSISLNAGDIVQFFSTNPELSDESFNFKIHANRETYVYGNIMSLIDDQRSDPNTPNFANDVTIANKCALRCLFEGAKIASHATKQLLLPATTLADDCYRSMFEGCTSLTTAPVLPATTLGSKCYQNMFYGCTSLAKLPANLLPAKTLADNCYYSMFYGCTGLTSLPEKLLPAKTLANNCYVNMFYGCTGLTSLPAGLLPATTLVEYCYAQMFHSCTGLTTLPANLLPATTLDTYCYAYMFSKCSGLTTLPADLLPVTTLCNACYWGMFENCTSLTTAPDLPAQTLVGSCYYLLFDGCTKLSSVKCLATDINAYNSLGNWLNGAGTAEGCERKLYVDPTMVNNGNWKLDTSGENGKRWTTVAITE
ncbi:MAG: leucine-rich repeat protein [Prevotella sp.]|nr:leucine-rich repeat protein [Prevotella sp.]